MACLQLGLVESLDVLAARWQLDSSWQQVQSEGWRMRHYTGWLEAVERTRSSG
jgi:glycerol kinase